MIKKEKYPILETSTEDEGLLTRFTDDVDTEKRTLVSERGVLAFVKERVLKNFVKEFGGVKICTIKSVSKRYPVYKINFNGTDVCLCQGGVGAPISAGLLIDWFIAHGAKKIIACGSCGCLEHFEEGEFLIPTKALRDEGVSYKYLPPERFIDLDKSVIKTIEKVLRAKKIKCKECVTWTTDAIYRETPEMVAYRKKEGCQVVEMECSALASVARRRGVEFGQVLFTGDSLADVENYDARNFGKDAHETVLELCVEIACNL